ncbi:MAG: universal stress protein [Solirubrobacteraceae bacterium]|jgi:nucleotide-binding universal stress UspA family protein|nr:universal stress protein [Solirubrobacteraceae bacterium]
MNNELILGYDGSAGAHAALIEAVRLARDLGATLGVVFSYEPPAREAGEVADQREAIRELGVQIVQEAEARLADLGFAEYEALLIDDRPADGLVRVADERDARMIVVGGAGERPIAGALLGATPHNLLHLTDRPVLVVRQHDD